jgi:hypothetical protein
MILNLIDDFNLKKNLVTYLKGLCNDKARMIILFKQVDDMGKYEDIHKGPNLSVLESQLESKTSESKYYEYHCYLNNNATVLLFLLMAYLLYGEYPKSFHVIA